MSSESPSPISDALAKNEEVRVCECECKRKFVVSKRSPRRFFDRGCAARSNAVTAKRVRVHGRKKVGYKERNTLGIGSFARQMRVYEDEEIAAGRMQPRRSFREIQSKEVSDAVAKKAKVAGARKKPAA